MTQPTSLIKRVGRYELHNELAHGGTASVHLGKLVGPVGFARTVAIKRLHPHLLKEVEFRDMFVDEARLAARIRHPNVVSIIDVIHLDAELFLVMDLVQGVSLHRLMEQARLNGSDIPIDVAAGVMVGALQGLHSAHEVKGERGERLNIVHRDVSPHNIMVATDGVPRVLDFGIAKAAGKLHNTSTGVVKGKYAYMPPEQLSGEDVGAQADVYAAGVVLWELLTGRRLFQASSEGQLVAMVLQGASDSPQKYRPQVPAALAAAVMKAICPRPAERYSSAREFAIELENASTVASTTQIGRWVERLAAEALDETALMVAGVESRPSVRSFDEHRASDPMGAVTSAMPSAKGSSSSKGSSSFKPSPESTSSQVSSVVVTQASKPHTAPSSRMALFALAVVVIALVPAFALLRSRTGPSGEPARTGAEAPAAMASAPLVASPSTTLLPSATSAPIEESPPSASASAVASADAPQAAKRPVVSPRITAAHARPTTPVSSTPPTPRPRAPAADCDPPYTRDSRGIQRIKPQCM